MKSILLNPQTYEPKIQNERIDNLLRRIGIAISESNNEYSNVSIRYSELYSIAAYGFKNIEDLKIMVTFLIDNEINFECEPKNNGAQYPYHLILRK